MALLGGLSIVIVLLVFLAVLTVSNAIVLSIAHAELNKNKNLISSDPNLQAAQHALYIDLWISWIVVGLYIVLIGTAMFFFIYGGEFVVAGAATTVPVAGSTQAGRKAGSKLALGTILVLVAIALLFFGIVIGVESFYAAQAARNIIKSTYFTGTGSLSNAYWYSFVSAALGLSALILILTALGSMVMTWVIQGRSKAIIGKLEQAVRTDASETARNLKTNVPAAAAATAAAAQAKAAQLAAALKEAQAKAKAKAAAKAKTEKELAAAKAEAEKELAAAKAETKKAQSAKKKAEAEAARRKEEAAEAKKKAQAEERAREKIEAEAAEKKRQETAAKVAAARKKALNEQNAQKAKISTDLADSIFPAVPEKELE